MDCDGKRQAMKSREAVAWPKVDVPSGAPAKKPRGPLRRTARLIRSLGFDAGFLRDFTPAHDFVGDKFGELFA